MKVYGHVKLIVAFVVNGDIFAKLMYQGHPRGYPSLQDWERIDGRKFFKIGVEVK
jgi:hypothetical protein